MNQPRKDQITFWRISCCQWQIIGGQIYVFNLFCKHSTLWEGAWNQTCSVELLSPPADSEGNYTNWLSYDSVGSAILIDAVAYSISKVAILFSSDKPVIAGWHTLVSLPVCLCWKKSSKLQYTESCTWQWLISTVWSCLAKQTFIYIKINTQYVNSATRGLSIRRMKIKNVLLRGHENHGIVGFFHVIVK